MTGFVRHLTALRKTLPVLRRNRFLTGDAQTIGADLQVKDVTWLAPDGVEMDAAHWHDPQTRCFGMLLDGRAPASSIARPTSDRSVLIVFNGWQDALEFVPPECPGGAAWTRLVDTALDQQEDADHMAGERYTVTGRSMLVFATALV